MNKEQFLDRMLTDEKIFSGYANLFMDSRNTKAQAFLDWAWEQYREGVRPGSASRGFDDEFSFDRVALGVIPENSRTNGAPGICK